VVTGESDGEIEKQRAKMRAQISFYASTPTYRTPLEVHGWEKVGEELGKLARNKRWDEMPNLVTDEMLSAFTVEAAPDEIGPALRERYEGLIDRVALYAPFVPGQRAEFWSATIGSVHATE
jgi:Luciferase-like monooxygenase